MITFTSSSTVKNFVALLGPNGRSRHGKRPSPLEGITLASIGPVTSATLSELKLGATSKPGNTQFPASIEAIVRNSRKQHT